MGPFTQESRKIGSFIYFLLKKGGQSYTWQRWKGGTIQHAHPYYAIYSKLPPPPPPHTHTPRVHTLLKLAQLRWTGHVTRMPEERLPKKIPYGELEMGKRSHGSQKKRYKDTLKASLKDFNIPLAGFSGTQNPASGRMFFCFCFLFFPLGRLLIMIGLFDLSLKSATCYSYRRYSILKDYTGKLSFINGHFYV